MLRGRDATARFDADSDHLRWEDGKSGLTVRIPLEAVEEVRGRDRSAGIVLTTALTGVPAPVYEVRGASAAGVSAFAAAVGARLPRRAPGDPRPEGTDLVTTTPAPDRRRPSRRTLAVATVIALLLAVDVGVAALDHPAFGVLLPAAQLFAAMGASLVVFQGRALYDGVRLSRHGVTVVAELDLRAPGTKAYRYTDLDGGTHYYREPAGGRRLELSYDPRDPARAATRPSPFHAVLMALVTLIGLGLACGGVALTGYAFLDALRG